MNPLAPDKTGYDSIFLYPQAIAGDPKYFEQRDFIMGRDWGHARNEDAAVLRAVQQGRKSAGVRPAFPGSILGVHDPRVL